MQVNGGMKRHARLERRPRVEHHGVVGTDFSSRDSGIHRCIKAVGQIAWVARLYSSMNVLGDMRCNRIASGARIPKPKTSLTRDHVNGIQSACI
jgi:hypothetical protein